MIVGAEVSPPVGSAVIDGIDDRDGWVDGAIDIDGV